MRLLAFLYLSLQLVIVFAQEDSLAFISELEFNSDFEEETYKSLLEGDTDYFKAFYAPFTSNDIRVAQERQQFYLGLEIMKSQKREKKNAKYLKRVYESLHRQYLKKYEEQISFDRIFEDGWYNCVTACAIYGLAFEDFGIPFIIKETPTHVYILAYPEGDEIVIETTDPVNGLRDIDDGFKRNFVTLLQQQKVIDSNELSEGVDAIFNKYYYSASEISLKQLVGIQYYNSGIEDFSGKSYASALNNFKKAHFLYPESEQIKDMMYASISTIVSGQSYNELKDFNYLAEISRYDSYEVTEEQIAAEFGKATQNLLINKNDTTLYDSAYQLISTKLDPSDSMAINQIDYIYYYERARVLYNRAYFKRALFFAKQAYEVKPESIDSETLLIACFSNAYMNAETEVALGAVNEIIQSYPDLLNNIRFGSVWQNLHLAVMYDAFIKKKYTLGFEMKKKFESIAMDHPEFIFEKDLAGSAYSQLVAYYFRKGQITSARKALNKGFSFAPNNPELKTRQYLLNR